MHRAFLNKGWLCKLHACLDVSLMFTNTKLPLNLWLNFLEISVELESQCCVRLDQAKYKTCRYFDNKHVLYLGHPGNASSLIFMGLTGITGIIAFSAGIIAMIVSTVIVLFLGWTLLVDYFYANVINESVG